MRAHRKIRKAEALTGFEEVGHRHAKIKVVEIDNPHFSAVHAGSPGNPKTITAAMNLRESPVALMAAKGHLEMHHVQAANKFRKLWERLGGSGAGSFDYSREPVDGGGAREPITDTQIEAGLILKLCQTVIGTRAFRIVEAVCGEGRSIADISPSKREKTTNADYLRNALDDLASHWGYKTAPRKV
jgi:hypothetical protein